MLLDTAFLYYQAFFGRPRTLTAPDGTVVNAVRGLLDAVAALVGTHRPGQVVACWDDDWRPAWRVAAVPSYKLHRVAEPAVDPDVEATPDELAPQVEIIRETLTALGIPIIGVPDYEADDVIATLAVLCSAGGPVDIVTGDRDLFQLVDDSRGIRVLWIAKGIRNTVVVDETYVQDRYGVPAAAYADLALLRGDPSDGLPGVPGIGEKTGSSLLARYGSVDALLAALDAKAVSDIPAGQRLRLATAREYLAAAGPVVRVVRDLPISPPRGGRLPLVATDPQRLALLAQRWGLGTSIPRVVDTLGR